MDFSLRPSSFSPPADRRRLLPPMFSAWAFSASAAATALPLRGSSTRRGTIGSAWASASTHAGSLEMPSQVYEEALSFCTTSRLSSTFTMS